MQVCSSLIAWKQAISMQRSVSFRRLEISKPNKIVEMDNHD